MSYTAPCCGATKEDVLDLPPKLRTWLDVEVKEGTAQKEMEVVLGLLLQGQRQQAGPTDVPVGRDRARLVAQLTKVRRKLAEAKTSTTIEYVQNILDQGDKVLVFSCFDAPLKKIYKRFGDAAVLLTGATPADKRQGLVDRFQAEEGVRVFVANILAGGVGLNLTAAQQVVFNDLDWVPANHWQAEDRAYRIGQERSVHVAYMVAEKTVDEFVRTVLETKAALVSSVVDGKALTDGATRDVLSELERIVGLISPKMADTSAAEVTGDQVRAWLQEASAHFHEAQPDSRADVLQADNVLRGPRNLDQFGCEVRRVSAD